MWGTDQAASLSKIGMETLSNILNKTQKILGDGNKDFQKMIRRCFKNLNIGIKNEHIRHN